MTSRQSRALKAMVTRRVGLTRRVGGHWEVEGCPTFQAFGLTLPTMWISTLEVRDLDKEGLTIRPLGPSEGRPERRVLTDIGLALALALMAG